MMPIKTIPVLFVSFLFIMTGLSFSALFVAGPTAFNISFAVVSHLATVFLLRYIVAIKKRNCLFSGVSDKSGLVLF